MAREQVLEISCDRCSRVEKVNLEKVKPQSTTILTMTFDGATVSFGDLCSPCYRAVKSHIEAITKTIEGVSPDRKMKSEAKEMPRKETEAKERSQLASSPHDKRPVRIGDPIKVG